MPYGNAQRLGDTIDPRLMQADFSGFANAGMIQGQALANAGKQIGDSLKLYGEEKKQHVAAEQMAKSMAKAIPEFKPMADEFLQTMANPDLSHRDKTAMAASIQDALKLAVLGKSFSDDAENRLWERNKFNETMNLERDKLSMKGEPQGTYMSRDEFSKLMNSGVPVKGVPTADGRIFVTDISGNQPGILGSGVAMVNGQPTRVPAQQVNLPSWGGAETGIVDGINMGNTTPLPDDVIAKQVAENGLLPQREIQALVDATPQVGTGNYPQYPNANQPAATNQTAQQIQQAQSLVPNAPVPKGDVWRMDKDGLMAGRIPGSESEIDYKLKEQQLKETEAKTAQAQAAVSKDLTAEQKSAKQEFSKTNFIIDKANEAEQIIKNDIADYGAGSIIDMGKSKIPGTAAYSLQNQVLPALKDAIALDNLRQLKASSPTGSSGMGSLTEKEGQRLENAYGKLDVGGDKNILLKDIARLKEDVFNAVHGSKAEREKALKEGKITQDQNNQVEQMYNEQILGIKSESKKQGEVGISPEVEQMLKDLGL